MSTHAGERPSVRDLWRVVEPYYQLASRSDEAVERLSSLGLDRPDLQYFASRTAPLGPVSAGVAAAVLFGFAPAYVARSIPDAWDRATPEQVTAARFEIADATCRRILGDDVDAPDLAHAAGLARRVAEACDLAGRPLAAANLELGWPRPPHLQLWHACTVLREHRGDAHWAATSASLLDSCECHVLHAADGHMPAGLLQQVNGWDDLSWAAATDRLADRGLVERVDSGVSTTDAGAALKLAVEHRTDRLASVPWRVLDDGEMVVLRDTMAPVVGRILDAGIAAFWRLREEMWREMPPDVS